MIKKLVKNKLPRLFKTLWKLKRSRRFRRLNHVSDFRAKQALVSHYGKKILSGPFQGMRYGDHSSGSSYVAKLIGCYEAELHSVIASILAKNPEFVIDIGCAEGYYAVGFAKCLPKSQIYAFDIDADAREYCVELAELNHVSAQIQISERCAPVNLEKMLRNMKARSVFLICDCEGYEIELFDPISVPSLKHCDFLVEFHEFLIPGATQTLCERFEATHSSQLIDTRARDETDYACLSVVAAPDRAAAVAKNRPGPMQWGYFEAFQR